MTHIRHARKSDVLFIYKMICELASFEKASHRVKITEETLLNDGFSEDALFKCIILEIENKPAGFALFYNRYSTWMGKSLYLEDLCVLPEYRGNGLGTLAMKYLAKYAIDTNCKRFEWQVLDWNEPAIDFYKSIETDLDSEWINCRLEGNSLVQLSKNN